MLQYNRARRAEWLEAQKQMEADSLATARIAYLRGDATEEQIQLVEEANREAEEQGVKLPPLLSPPEHRTHFEEHLKPTFESGSTAEGKGVMGVFSGLFGGSKDNSSSDSDSPVTDAAQSIEAKARSAWETEKFNQSQGGSLDRLGLDVSNAPPPAAKKSWWRW